LTSNLIISVIIFLVLLKVFRQFPYKRNVRRFRAIVAVEK